MTQDHTPEDVDWVSAQSKCNAALTFERLQAGVQQDVERRNAIGGRHDGWTFEFHEEDNEFEVSRLSDSGRVMAVVKFERAGRRIHVQGEDVEVDFTAVVSLDPAGVCRCVVGEALYSEWEIRRMALEQLFFEETEVED